jgi:pimeloyl-ACP methyl ester carboxylesterase
MTKHHHVRFKSRYVFTPLLAALALSACGGSDDNNNSGTPTVAAAEAARPQDARTFTPVQPTLNAMTNAAGTPAAPDTDRWVGVNKGASYAIEVPKNWNGMLVMYAHGYAGTGANLTAAPPAIRRHLISQGYAWAASSYSKNYYDVRAGVEDTNALALAFNDIAKTNGRTLAAPSKTYIIGVSMGGHIAGAAVDEENIATATNKVRYSGAVPMCGVLGDTELFDYFTAYQLAAQKEAGFPATSWPVANWAEIQPQVQGKLFSSFPTTATPTAAAVPTAQGQQLKTIVQNLTGGARPLFDVGYAGPLQSTVWGTFGSDGTITGILNERVVSTVNTVYQLDNNPAVSAAEQAYTDSTLRVTPVTDANRLRTDGLRWVPKTNALISVPVVTIHTLGDLYVPFSMEQIYKRRADKLGTSNLLVQRAIRGVSHCDFTFNEQAAAFDAMINWEQKGVKPAGDDVLTPATVADPKYGCKFTDNNFTQDDSAAVQTVRRNTAIIPSCS